MSARKLETFQSVLRLSPSATRSTAANDIGYLDFCTLSFSKVSLSLEDILSILEGTCFLFPQFLCVLVCYYVVYCVYILVTDRNGILIVSKHSNKSCYHYYMDLLK